MSSFSCLPVDVKLHVALSSCMYIEKHVHSPRLPSSLPHVATETGSAAPRDRQPLLLRWVAWDVWPPFLSRRLGSSGVRPGHLAQITGVRVNIRLSPCVLLLFIVGNLNIQMKRVECNESPCAHIHCFMIYLVSSV